MEITPAPDGQCIQFYASTAIRLPITYEQRHLDFADRNPERTHHVEVTLHFDDFVLLPEGNLSLLLVHINQKDRVF